jgi:hypothetical protein
MTKGEEWISWQRSFQAETTVSISRILLNYARIKDPVAVDKR